MSRPFAIERISFLTPGSFPAEDPSRGLEDTLRLFVLAEELGYDGGWVRQRHLENSVSSSATLLAAATQRTSRIALGSAVIQMDYESPFRLAEDLATVDALSGGRLRVGLSGGAPTLAGWLGDLFPQPAENEARNSYKLIEHLVDALSGRQLGPEEARIVSAAGSLRPRVQPHAAGLTDRLWYGAGSARSVEWAARNGFNLLVGNIQTAENDDAYAKTQLRHLERFRALSSRGADARLEVGRVILPFNGASRATRERYQKFAEERLPRTLEPQGERRVQFAPDLVGNTDDIVQSLLEDVAVTASSEIRIELPYNFAYEDYAQILHDFATLVAPYLGWKGGRLDKRKTFPADGNVIPIQRGG